MSAAQDSPATEPDRTPDPSQPASRKPRLLLVEDDRATYSALRLILARDGWEVTVATTIADALPLLDRLQPRWVILDLMLPDGDGGRVLRAIRERHLQIRVAVTTAVRDPDRLADLFTLNPEVLLRKPVELDELLRSLVR